jgi:hypothetical protein
MIKMRVVAVVLLSASLGACAAKAQARTEVEVPLLDPPPPPPRVVAVYAPEPELLPITPAVEPATPVRPQTRPSRPEQRPETSTATEPVESATRPPSPSLTLTPTAGSEAQTVTAIRDLIGRATRDLSRVNSATLNTDGRAQYDTARRFIQQAEDALRARNIVFAGKLADKAATMAAVLVR